MLFFIESNKSVSNMTIEFKKIFFFKLIHNADGHLNKEDLRVRLSSRSVFLSRFLKQAERFLGTGLGQIYIFSARAITLSQIIVLPRSCIGVNNW